MCTTPKIYSIKWGENSPKFPKIPRPHPVVHLHYLEHFGASAGISCVRLDIYISTISIDLFYILSGVEERLLHMGSEYFEFLFVNFQHFKTINL